MTYNDLESPITFTSTVADFALLLDVCGFRCTLIQLGLFGWTVRIESETVSEVTDPVFHRAVNAALRSA